MKFTIELFSFGHLFIYTYVVTDKRGGQMVNNCNMLCSLVNLLKSYF